MSAPPEPLGLEEGFAAAIDRDGEIPIGVQLGWALRGSIRDGRFVPGERLPGLRELADAVGVNVNTVRAVYQRLEREGLIDSRQGSGTFVAPRPPQPSTVASIAADAAREAHATGADPREVAAALYVAPPDAASRPARGSASAGNDADASGSARRRALRAQIATLERAIGEMEAEHPGVAPRPTAARRLGGPALLGADELEQVRSGLVRRLAAVQSAIDEQTTVAAAGGEESTQKKAANARARARARTRARVDDEKDNAPTPDPDPASVPASTPKRPTRPRSTGRPAAAGT